MALTGIILPPAMLFILIESSREMIFLICVQLSSRNYDVACILEFNWGKIYITDGKGRGRGSPIALRLHLDAFARFCEEQIQRRKGREAFSVALSRKHY